MYTPHLDPRHARRELKGVKEEHLEAPRVLVLEGDVPLAPREEAHARLALRDGVPAPLLHRLARLGTVSILTVSTVEQVPNDACLRPFEAIWASVLISFGRFYVFDYGSLI